MTSIGEQGPFQTLVKLIEHELELAGRGLIDELEQAVDATGAFLATLPVPAPEAARPLLLRADALRRRVTIETLRLKEGVEHSRSSLRRSRKIARRYGGQPSTHISTSA